MAGDFADGIYWVPLAPISSPVLVTSAIAKALDVRERGGHSLQESLVHYLRDRTLLLLLDNFEHLLKAGPLLTRLLAAAQGAKILVTSRAGLELRGEYEFPVPPLSLPNLTAATPTPARLMKNAAVRLFVERARAAKPDFKLTSANSAAVQEIVRRLEGLPLAIELAAARVKLLPPGAILARLSSRLQLLTGGARDLPARQQTMRSTLDWSYQLLEEPARVVLARLGIFAGSFTLAAAEAVAGTTEELDVFEGIAALVSNSLLRQSLDETPLHWSEPRFSMLETVREYALERLAAAGEVGLLQQRHGAYFAQLAAEAEPQYFSGQSEAWLDRMAADYSNFRAALLWLQSRPETHRMSWHLIRDLLWLWYQRGYLNEARQWYEKALAQSVGLVKDPLRGYILVWSGMVAMWQSDLATAARLMDQGLPLQRTQGDKADLAVSLFGRGVLAVNQGDRVTARRVLEESLKLYQALDQQWFQAMILLHLGNVALDEADVDGALALQQDALARGKQVGDRWVIASGINNLGEIARYLGEHEAAEEHYLESRSLFHGVDSVPDVARADHSLAFVALARGDADRASMLFQQSIVQHERLGVKRGVVEGVNGLAALLSVQGQPALAARLFTAAETQLARLGAGIWPADRMETARYQAKGRAELGESAFAAACAAGRELAWTEALALARAATADQQGGE
ncbi:MAG: hypothetical protein R3300_01370 [Candidatus Promineifilaceae bacterium]|nr:hypothetical protein [Candidatus Promineifilaceae bacterium]